MRSIILAALIIFSTQASAENQIASLVTFESTAARPTTEDKNITSIVNTGMELVSPSNISVYGGFSFIIGEDFESAVVLGTRFYSATPAFQLFPGIPMWSYIGAGIASYDEVTYYPEAGFRVATSDATRLDVFIKILNSKSDVYDKHFMVGAGLTF
ncbi:hypothetical protein ACUM5Y_10420 [Marinomonas dokdonensis]|uniref:hypothetical protein n=1 Tax=Marinomonas dokdonensis TaxID=328224 RepID=UPI00405547F9